MVKLTVSFASILVRRGLVCGSTQTVSFVSYSIIISGFVSSMPFGSENLPCSEDAFANCSYRDSSRTAPQHQEKQTVRQDVHRKASMHISFRSRVKQPDF